jgi:AcrR family transcriptional regulator
MGAKAYFRYITVSRYMFVCQGVIVSQRLTRQEKQAATRQALIEAASQVFARDGIDGASLEDICEQAGFSRGAFYSNFADKRQLFLETLDRRTADNLAEIATAFGDGETIDDRLVNGARAAERVVDRDHVWCQLYYEGWVLASRDEKFRTTYAQRYEAMRQAIADVIEAAASASATDLGVSSRELASALVAFFEGYALQRLVDPHALADGWFGRTLRALLGRPVPPDGTSS